MCSVRVLYSGRGGKKYYLILKNSTSLYSIYAGTHAYIYAGTHAYIYIICSDFIKYKYVSNSHTSLLLLCSTHDGCFTISTLCQLNVPNVSTFIMKPCEEQMLLIILH